MRILFALFLFLFSAYSQANTIFDPDFEFSPSPINGTEGVLPVHGPSECELMLLTQGPISYEARLKILEEAKKSIVVQQLIFTADASGLKLAEILKKKKAEGLDVRVIVDAISNPGWATQWMYYDLMIHGVQVEGYEALYMGWINEVSIKNPFLFNKRYHDKLIIVDGEIAIAGGRNIADEYYQNENLPKMRWRDQDVLVRGAIVHDLVTVFERNFGYFKDIKKSRLIFNTDISWTLWRKFVVKVLGRWTFKFKKGRYKIAQVYVKWAEARAKRLKFDWFKARARFIQSRPRMKEEFIKQAYENLIENAKGEVLIANAYFVPSKELIQKIHEAVARGVKVKILTNSIETNDLPELTILCRASYKRILEANEQPEAVEKGGKVEIYEWRGDKFGEGTIHAKFMIVDSFYVVIGSYNLDPRSENLNSETAMAFHPVEEDPKGFEEIKKFRTQYLKYDLAKSEKVTKEQAEEYENPTNIKDKVRLTLTKPTRPLL